MPTRDPGREVYITGLGVNTPLGAGVETFWTALAAGTSGLGPVTRFDTSWLPIHIAAEIKDLDGLRNLSPEEPQAWGPAARLALSVSRAALADAGWLGDDGRSRLSEINAVFGTTHGDLNEHVVRCQRAWEQPDPTDTLDIARDIIRANVTYGFLNHIAQNLGLTGWQSINTNACAASGYALCVGAERIRQGLADVVLAGGVDLLAAPDYVGFCSLRALAPDRCRPFDQDRRGLVMGEAGAVLVLESGESLRQRGGRAYAQLLGYGWSSDGFHLSTPHPEGWGTRRSLELALEDAGLSPGNIDAIIAHGTGTPGNDRTEAHAFRAVFGPQTPPVTAPKSMIGHAMGAASAIEAVIGVLSLTHQCLPPTIDHETTDPECPIDVVANRSRSLRLRHLLTNSSGFGGNNDSLIFATVPAEMARRSPAPELQPTRPPARYGSSGEPTAARVPRPVGPGSSMRDRLLITGTSLVCSLGSQPQAVARRLLTGDSGLKPCSLPRFGLSEPVWFAAVEPDLKEVLGGKGWRNHNRAALMACLAARDLQADAGLSSGTWRPEDTGLVMGFNHNLFSPEFEETIKQRNLNLLNPAFFLNISTNAVASQVTIFLQLRAFAMTVTTGFLAGLEALDQAALALRAGRARRVMAGGAEERNDQFCYSFHQAFRQDTDAGQPAGLRLGAPSQISAGEGCGLLLLETEAEARSRGARVRGAFLGSGQGVNPAAFGHDPAAAEAALRKALIAAQIEPGQVGALFLAANGHASQDQAEAEAVRRVFGPKAPPAVALKGALGETYHAHGALAAVLALECLAQKQLPGTAHLAEPGLAQALKLSAHPRPLDAGPVVVLALEQDRRAAAIVLGAAS